MTRALVEECERLGHVLVELAESGEPGRVNRSLIAAIAGHGLFDRLFSDNTVTATDLCSIRQGLARVSTAAETAFAVQGLGAIPIHLNGVDELCARVMPAIRGGTIVAAFALTEPGAGSDAAALVTTAERDGNGFRLNGEKAYISNAPDADMYTLFARTTPDSGSRGITAFVVTSDMGGLRGEPIPMLSPHPVGRLHLDDVFVPAENVLGEIDHGFRVAMQTLDLFRPSVGAFALGMAEAALRIAASHATTRTAFGAPISDFQGVSHQLADVRLAIESAELLVYSAAAAHDDGDNETLTGKAAMAKLHATETAQLAVDTAIQVLGARGLEADSTLAHLYLEVRAPRIYEGTSEIQRNIIAREMFSGRI
ncbi:MAG TPA: acyl-CoA dehydrogenase family protein [Acidimicrobiia bacterium]|nr:acyl-CoA dehydrogenase family protein [Acidimicrobiia bacterium]